MNVKRSSQPQWFFSEKEKKAIIEAIKNAEKQTSGEIRLHLEMKARENFMDHAKEVFQSIGMKKTEQKNGVLIFMGIKSRRFAILGDLGIDQVVPAGFWDDAMKTMSEAFKEDRFADGIVDAVEKIGEKLKEFFPHEMHDKNELEDCISYSL